MMFIQLSAFVYAAAVVPVRLIILFITLVFTIASSKYSGLSPPRFAGERYLLARSVLVPSWAGSTLVVIGAEFILNF